MTGALSASAARSRRWVAVGPASVAVALACLGAWPAAGAPAPATAAAAASSRPTPTQLRAAKRFAASREGAVSYAVIDTAGRLRSHGGTRSYPAASMGKALLLVATLRRYADAPVPPAVRRQLEPMIRVSDNDAAHTVYRALGDAPLRAVARDAGLRRLTLNGTWSNIGITAPDVARLFHRLDRVVPERHRSYAHALLGSVSEQQRWGIPRALRRHGWAVELKGGWRGKLVHQGALARRGRQRVALAILTDHSPSHEYGRWTLQGLARRLLTTSR